MRFNFLTLFPEKIHSYFAAGLPAKAIENQVITIHTVNIRDFSSNKHHRVDDTIYGGGPGMLLQIEPIEKALQSLADEKGHVCLLSASGQHYHQQLACELAQMTGPITFISGYYEGIDHRVSEHLVDREISIGNYVISAGDLAALCVCDSITRLLPGFMGQKESLTEESHNIRGLLEYPQYTKPSQYKDWQVPDVLLSGNHAEIEKWRQENRKQLDNE